jgi:hypothetical protein
MVIHGLLLCKLKNLQNYSDGAGMLMDLYLNGETQFMRCAEKESSVGCETCVVFCIGQSWVHFYLLFI